MKKTYIAEDIRKNPLLISNLIFIYFATRELQTQKSFILERSSGVLIDSLEKDRLRKDDSPLGQAFEQSFFSAHFLFLAMGASSMAESNGASGGRILNRIPP